MLNRLIKKLTTFSSVGNHFSDTLYGNIFLLLENNFWNTIYLFIPNLYQYFARVRVLKLGCCNGAIAGYHGNVCAHTWFTLVINSVSGPETPLVVVFMDKIMNWFEKMDQLEARWLIFQPSSQQSFWLSGARGLWVGIFAPPRADPAGPRTI